MLGVVVWADQANSKAIVWCEDHGDLAYISMCSHPTASGDDFDAGDLIQFDLALHNNLRMAENPKRVAQHYCASIDQVVETAGMIKTKASPQLAKTDPALEQVQVQDDARSNVIDFETARFSRLAG